MPRGAVIRRGYDRHMRMGVLVVVGAVAGCTSEPDEPPQPVDLSVTVLDPILYWGQSAPAQVFATPYIEGEARSRLTQTFPSREVYDQATVAVELRYGDLVLDRRTVGGADGCGDDRALLGVSYALCHFAQGQLGYVSVSADTDGGNCVADYLCSRSCFDTSCSPGSHCTSVMTSFDPPFSRFECTAIGTRAVGEACTWTATADGYHHDCDAGLLCLDDVCRTVCTDGPCPGCSNITGHSWWMKVCS